MLDIKFIKKHAKKVKWAIEVKNEKVNLDDFLKLHGEMISLKTQLQNLQTRKNTQGKLVAEAPADKRAALIAEGKKISTEIDHLRPVLEKLEDQYRHLALRIPAIPHEAVPVGVDEGDNVEIKKGGSVPHFSFSPRDHRSILEKNHWAEFQKVANICGNRSYGLKDDMILLEMSMHRYALDLLMEKGATVIQMPSLVREETLVGTGHFPMGRDQVYHIPKDNLYLSGTAEVQLNSLHAGEILESKKLPLFYAGYSPCFRREAGSYGRDVRGLVRVHQFQKVEQYVICKNDPDESATWHQKLLDISLEIVEGLELPYRVVECCTGDMGTGKVRMFDVECWIPSEKKYRETHSCSCLYDWQARRTNIRYRDEDETVHYGHTLNNTALATPRIMVSFLECHQQEDGSVNIPGALQKYMGQRKSLGGRHGKK